MPARSRSTLNIAVIGGSLGGLFAAVLLHQAGHTVTVFERSTEGLSRRGAGLVAQQELFEVSRAVGIHVDDSFGVEAYERITLDRSGRVLSRDATPQVQLSWDVLYEEFRSRLPQEGYRLGAAVTAVRTDGEEAVIAFADGAEARFDLVVGADGLRSVVRRAVAPEAHENTYVGYVTWRGLVPELSLPPTSARTLLERFAFFTAPGAHMLGYLVPGSAGETRRGDRRYNWVWYRPLTAADLAALMSAVGRSAGSVSTAPGELPRTLRDELVRDAHRELPPPFAEAVEAEGSPFLQAIFDYVPPRMTRGRVALIGDAAAVVRPHTAMGAAKAAGDAMTLAALLGEHDVPRALAGFDADRLPIARAIADYGRRLGAGIPLLAPSRR
ncbi:FAD-dependent monooxygenase [Microbacterium sp. W4I20]|uniref:FAD binding domain-containing protein n=1 Tax=Microbacterium sp. W4I20 TaxID=3042262 RepID=UPI00277F76E4|nr:FAD-dependent monooxygenase [Microbacterium sp. W4I20]MDQ0727869.1 2-polyprenyl-6-methoxyphenol hydroxylase-like FAD-dependent oxidoreductase [Microbacterium sp. W4I20]